MKTSLTGGNEPCCLTIDQGGHAIRAMVFDAQSRLITAAQEEIALDGARGGHQEYEARTLLDSLRRAISTAIGQLPVGCPAPRSAALATQRANMVCWDRNDGAPLSPIISWQDRRGAAWLEQSTAQRDTIRRITGLPLSAHYGAAKFRWCLDHLPAVHEALDENRLAMGPMASFLIFHLLQERPLLSDPVNASRTLLWDLERRDWSPCLLDLFDLPATALPRCAPTRHAYGTLDTGGNHIPLTVVTGDQAAALFAHGEPDPDTIYITLGTGAFIQRPIGTRPSFTSTLLTSVLTQEARTMRYTLEGTINGAGGALDWLEKNLGVKLDFKHLSQWLARNHEPPLFLNGITGLGTPFMRADFPSRFIGESGTMEKACAVIESIVFLIQLNLENMQSVSGPAANVVAGGGLARLDGLCQRIADLSALPVLRVDDHETTSHGLAYLLTGHAPQRIPSDSSRFTPAEAPALNDRYRRWKQIMSESA